MTLEDVADVVMALMIKRGANVNAADKYDLTALHHAALRGNVQATKRLMAAEGINREPKDIQECTPLHLAATYDHYRIAKILLDEGANPMVRICVSCSPNVFRDQSFGFYNYSA